MDALIGLIPHPSSEEEESSGGGHISPTITCHPECIYVYEVIHDSGDEG